MPANSLTAQSAAQETGNPPARDDIHIACLCAAWCDLCEAYGPVFDEVVSSLNIDGAALRRHWIDIEDQAELVGEFDVETFPTLVVIDRRQVRFAGPVTPQPQALRRLLRATVVAPGAAPQWPVVTPQVEAFAARLRGSLAAG